MSAPDKFGPGAGAISSTPNPLAVFPRRHNRNRLFLRRNVRRVIDALTMGSTISKMASPFSGAKHPPRPILSDDEDGDPQPPTKRRRLNTKLGEALRNARNGDEEGFCKPFGHVTNGTRPSGRFGARPVQPSDFYGKARSTAPAISAKRPFADISTDRRKCSIEKTLLRKPTDFKKSLRVDVCGIGPTLNEEDLRPSDWPLQVRCNLLVAIFCRKNDVEGIVERCRRVKTCMLRITIDDDGTVKREFDPPQSFIFAPNEFYVNRKTRKSSGNEHPGDGFDYTQDFAEKYRLQVTVEPVGYHEAWPPVIIPSVDELDPESESKISTALAKDATLMELTLFSETKNPLNPNRQSQSPELKVCFGALQQPLRDRLKLQIRWALPSPISAVATRAVKVESPVAAAALLSDVPLASPSRLPEDGSMPDSPANSRAQRVRSNVATYNLKALSTLAQGRSPRKRKPREKTSEADASGITVLYTLGSLDAAELGVKREEKVAGLKCPFCWCPNKSVNLLTFHLQNEHLNWTFQLRRAQPKVQYFLTSVKSRLTSSSCELQRTLQFTRPATVFELEKFINGDESWIKSRLGPQHNALPEHVLEGAQESSLSSSSRGSRFSSPNTSNDTDDMLDIPDRFKAFSATLPLRSERRLYVPRTDKPLYDTITKRILEPGEEIPNSDDEKEESWLIMKHRDAVNDYTDLTDEEKDYINQWNPFIMAEQLTSDKFLGNALYRFVVTNRDWLLEKQARLSEFARHAQPLKIKGVLTAEQRSKCFRVLRLGLLERERRKEEAEMNPNEDIEMSEKDDDISGNEEDDGSKPKSPKLRGPMTCICLEHVLHSDRVICWTAGPKKCPGKFYHRECAKISGRPISGKWMCDACFSSAPA